MESINITTYVYKISGNGMDYYGSSNQPIYERKATHKSQYRYYKKTGETNRRCCSYKIFDSYGDDWENGDWTFEIIAYYDTEREALEYENLCIINQPCVNKQRAIGLSEDELRKYKAEWAEQNRRKKGTPEKVKLDTPEKIEESKEKIKVKRSATKKEKLKNETEEEREVRLEKHRIYELTEERKQKNTEYLQRDDVKARRKEKQQKKRAEVTPEQKEKERLRRIELYNERTPEQIEESKRKAQERNSRPEVKEARNNRIKIKNLS